MTTDKILTAQAFAHEAHDSIKQVRKYSGEPYWVHTDAVARIVAEAMTPEMQARGLTKYRDFIITPPEIVEDMICTAHLHDVLEDVTPINPFYNYSLIENIFGIRVADMVVELTDVFTKEAYPKINRAERKRLECDRISRDSAASQTVKTGDLLHNTDSILSEDPGFAKTYLKEKAALLPVLRYANPFLRERAVVKTIEGFHQLGLTVPNELANLLA